MQHERCVVGSNPIIFFFWFQHHQNCWSDFFFAIYFFELNLNKNLLSKINGKAPSRQLVLQKICKNRNLYISSLRFIRNNVRSIKIPLSNILLFLIEGKVKWNFYMIVVHQMRTHYVLTYEPLIHIYMYIILNILSRCTKSLFSLKEYDRGRMMS